MTSDAHALAGPLLVTLGYVGWYYALQIHAARRKFALAREYAARGEKFDRYFGQDRQMLAADRMQLNMLEHMPPFLALLWLHAVFVSATGATAAGAVYLAARMLYPVVLGQRLGRSIRSQVMLSTVPGYVVLVYLMGGLVFALVAR
jgi:uncharacterized MAPEG superfamily protein